MSKQVYDRKEQGRVIAEMKGSVKSNSETSLTTIAFWQSCGRIRRYFERENLVCFFYEKLTLCEFDNVF